MGKEEKNMENVFSNGQRTMRKIQTSPFDTYCLRQVKDERQDHNNNKKKKKKNEAEKRTDEKRRVSMLICEWIMK